MGTSFSAYPPEEAPSQTGVRRATPSLTPRELTLGTHHDSPVMQKIRARLYHPALRSETSLLSGDFHPIDLCLASRDIAKQVDDIVDLAYCTRYSSRPPPSECQKDSAGVTTAPLAPRMSTEQTPTSGTRRFALCTIVNDTPIVLLTMRMALGDSMELPKFFSLPDTLLPHDGLDAGGARSAEMGRVAFHPILDEPTPAPRELRKRLAVYRTLAFRELWEFSLRSLRQHGTRYLFAIMAPHVAAYFATVGVPMRRIAGATLLDSDDVRTVRASFPRYWRPYGPSRLEPAPYRLGWTLRPLQPEDVSADSPDPAFNAEKISA